MVTYLYYTGTMLRENKVLTSLGLTDCGLGPHGVSEVCNAVGMITTLTSLDLSLNRLYAEDSNLSPIIITRKTR